MRFREWFFECQIAEARALLPPGVLQQWEAGFRQGLDNLIHRTSDPRLRSNFEAMRECPVRDMAGRCRTFTDYVVGTMLKHGVHRKADIEDALAYAFETMMSPRKVTGEPKTTVFDLDPRRPVGRNELEARFKTSVGNAVRNIASGKIRRLSSVEQRPQGTLSLVPGRPRGFSPGTIASDQLPARRDAGGDLAADIIDLLQRREAASGNLPLVSLFQSMLAGESDRDRRARFSDRVVRLGREVIVATIRDYAAATDNYQLLRLLQKLSAVDNQIPPAAPAAKPTFSPDEEDYRSIASVIRRAGRPVSLSELGSARRRWLQMRPRSTSSPHASRLSDVLARMVQDGVLKASTTRKGGTLYEPGPTFDRYL